MSINLKEAVDFLLSRGYLIRGAGGKLRVTQKVYDDLNIPGNMLMQLKSSEHPIHGSVVISPDLVDWKDAYIKFIMAAQVPERGETRYGEYYPMNKYSDPGMKAFKQAIWNGGIDLATLIRSTMLYYKSSIKLKVAIGRYMVEGLWRSDYEKLVMAQKDNTVEEHIKTELDNGTTTGWQVG